MPSRCPHNMVNFGLLLVSLRHPCKFQRVSCLGSVTARHSSSGRQPNFAALNRGRHLYSTGRPSRPHSSFFFSSPNLSGRRLDVYHTSCRSETCCARFAGNTGRKKSPKSRHLGTIPQLCRAVSSQACIHNWN